MLKSRLIATALLATLGAAPAFAQTANPVGGTVGTNVNQQDQIEQGLKSGELSSGEAARLEKGEKRIDNAEAHALKHGDTAGQAAHIEQMQTNEESRMQKLETNGVNGNPASASSQRMQSDVQRNVNQEQRIENGVNNGSLTNRETARMEHGQAKVDRAEARAGKNGHVGAREQAHIQARENRQSHKIHRAKHNGHVPAPSSTPATSQ